MSYTDSEAQGEWKEGIKGKILRNRNGRVTEIRKNKTNRLDTEESAAQRERQSKENTWNGQSFHIISSEESFYFGKGSGDEGIILYLCLQAPFFLCFHKYEHNTRANRIYSITVCAPVSAQSGIEIIFVMEDKEDGGFETIPRSYWSLCLSISMCVWLQTVLHMCIFMCHLVALPHTFQHLWHLEALDCKVTIENLNWSPGR